MCPRKSTNADLRFSPRAVSLADGCGAGAASPRARASSARIVSAISPSVLIGTPCCIQPARNRNDCAKLRRRAAPRCDAVHADTTVQNARRAGACPANNECATFLAYAMQNAPRARKRTVMECGHAGKDHDETCGTRSARRQISEHAGGRVRTRGDGAHPPRQAWRALVEAGDCDRLVESEARRREAAAAQTRDKLIRDAAQSRARQRSSEASARGVAQTLARDDARPQTRGARRGLARSAVAPSTLGRCSAQSRESLG